MAEPTDAEVEAVARAISQTVILHEHGDDIQSALDFWTGYHSEGDPQNVLSQAARAAIIALDEVRGSAKLPG